MKINEVMTHDVECARSEDNIAHVAERMRELDIGSIPVCDNDRLVGMVTDRDITVRATAGACEPTCTRVADVMTPKVIYCFDDQDVEEAARIMEAYQVRRLPVLDRNMRMVGIVSIGDVATKVGDDDLVGFALKHVSEPVGATR